eukprot:CAMPEP_0172726998 /NCGR_PEP_ID=MMETSP1074-20121228/91429_1 /TAXON_ID=2916 /ORGANISM="Ceratium fusus, Strain PA161109" /LENGTH=595 /DNA_ID=CAMNT_0013554111 /DNA_START=48 /DNA_END=1835 /DNA_ORIENTATION=+
MSRTNGGQSSTQAFLNSLPQSRLTGLETVLRQSILDFVRSRHPKGLPLSEWIEARIGAEVEVRRINGRDELYLRNQRQGNGVAESRMDPQTFLANLDPHGFSPDEEMLRDSIFEFLARWKSRERANLTDLSTDQGVKRAVNTFLPKGVPLRDWIELRIGGELEIKRGNGGQADVYVTPGGMPFVAAMYEEIASGSYKGVKGGKGKELDDVPSSGKGFKGLASEGRANFFNDLPANELLPEELALRHAVLKFIDDWPAIGASLGKPIGAVPLLSDLGQDPKVQSSRRFLPSKANLKEWIDRRIGGEVETRMDEKGQFQLCIRGSVPQRVRQASQRVRGSGSDEGADAAEEWIAKLPEDRHTDSEAELREAIIDYLQGKDGAVKLSDACKDQQIMDCRSAFLPPEVPLRLWIDRRIGGEVETRKDAVGKYMISMKHPDDYGNEEDQDVKEEWFCPDPPADSEASGVRPAEGDKEAQRKQFFADLPEDGLTPDEEQLHLALLEFLQDWKPREPPTLSHAAGDPRVKKWKLKLLPKGTPVTFSDWINSRISDEIELADDPTGNGQLHFGIRGMLDHSAISKKRSFSEVAAPSLKRGRGS